MGHVRMQITLFVVSAADHGGIAVTSVRWAREGLGVRGLVPQRIGRYGHRYGYGNA